MCGDVRDETLGVARSNREVCLDDTFGESAGELLPRRATVGGFVDAATGSVDEKQRHAILTKWGVHFGDNPKLA